MGRHTPGRSARRLTPVDVGRRPVFREVPLLAWLLVLAVRALAWTWRVDRPPWPVVGPCVVGFWHGDQLAMVALHGDVGVTGLASLSRDGALAAAVLSHFGYGVMRGSTSRGGLDAFLTACALVRRGGRPALALDGPRGPAGVAQPGATAIARRTGAPLVLATVEAAGWRLRSWDRFLIPYPFTRVRVRYAVTPGRPTPG